MTGAGRARSLDRTVGGVGQRRGNPAHTADPLRPPRPAALFGKEALDICQSISAGWFLNSIAKIGGLDLGVSNNAAQSVLKWPEK